MRGNVIELAVAVVVGAAFTNIVNAVVKGVINPIIGALGSQNLDNYKSCLTASCAKDPKTGGVTDGIYILWGSVLSSALTFVITAAVVYFLMILPMNKWKARQDARKPLDETPVTRPRSSCSPRSATRLVSQRNGSSPAPVGSVGTVSRRRRRSSRRSEAAAAAPSPRSEVVGRLFVEEAREIGRAVGGGWGARPSPGRCRRRTAGSADHRRSTRPAASCVRAGGVGSVAVDSAAVAHRERRAAWARRARGRQALGGVASPACSAGPGCGGCSTYAACDVACRQRSLWGGLDAGSGADSGAGASSGSDAGRRVRRLVLSQSVGKASSPTTWRRFSSPVRDAARSRRRTVPGRCSPGTRSPSPGAARARGFPRTWHSTANRP